MNVGRFNSAVYELGKEISKLKVLPSLEQLRATLENSINSPSDETSQQFKLAFSNLQKILLDAPSNLVFPSRKKIYQEIDAIPYFGRGLLSRIERIVAENNMTPAAAHTGIKKLLAETTNYYQRITTLSETLDKLDVEYSDLRPGEFEIGFLIPRREDLKTLDQINSEFHKLDLSLRPFKEITGDAGESPIINAISASEWQVFLDSSPAMALCLAAAIERIVKLYKTSLEIRMLKKDLEDKKVPETAIKPLQDYIEATVQAELRKIAEDLVDKYYKGDPQRGNELKNHTSMSLKYLADRLDHGATVEVHAEPPELPKVRKNEAGEEIPRDEAEMIRYEDMRKIVNEVNEAAINVTLLERSDEPMLSLNYDRDQSRNN